MAFYVNLLKDDRAYGGPEEGGWWYGTTEAIEAVRCSTLRKANKRLRRMRAKAADFNHGQNTDLNSIVSDGAYRAAITRNEPARHYPETRPHYC